MNTQFRDLISHNLPIGRKVITGALYLLLVILGFIIFKNNAQYDFMSDRHFSDILGAKLWTLSWISIVAFSVWMFRKSKLAPNLAVFGVSAYFVILYGLLFHGTEFGMNGYTGDMAGIYAEICKMMAFNSYTQDFFTKDLPSFYPPLWFALLAFYGKIIGIEAYQTYRWGYLLVFLVYPWLLFISWKKLIGAVAAAAICVLTFFLATKHVDLLGYQHATLALFIPWWLYYFESYGEETSKNWRSYLFGSIIGGLIFMTYYYWFFVAFAALPVTLWLRYYESRSIQTLRQEILHRIKMLLGVALVSSFYWLPLLVSIFERGFASAQNVWFFPRHANLALYRHNVTLESILIIAGVAAAIYLWNHFGKARLSLLYVGCIFLIIADRIFNLNSLTMQSRKILDMAHVFTIAPLTIAVVVMWQKSIEYSGVKKVIVGLFAMLILVSANSHTEIHHEDPRYKLAYNTRVPERALSVFDSVDVKGKVLLTFAYVEAAFIPYYSFTPPNNMSAHMAGNYWDRVDFLEFACKITDPELLAYALRYNRYDAIDFLFLPRDSETEKFRIQLNQVKFNTEQSAVFLPFEVDFAQARQYFTQMHNAGLFKLNAPEQDENVRKRLIETTPEIERHLRQ